MRGTLTRGKGDSAESGIIPAHAGNTQDKQRLTIMTGDHPRTCGEHPCRSLPPRIPQGSSPHMRGTHRVAVGHTLPAGIIPAHAGNTDTVSKSSLANRDHPRTCGEHRSWKIGKNVTGGSSPHMRGTHETEAETETENGIIPAHAGNTRHYRRAVALYRDHPRTCGEHLSCWFAPA